MTWQTINLNNLSKGRKVLAACFLPNSGWFKEKLIGYLVFDRGCVYCKESLDPFAKTIGSCTHYIDIEAEIPDVDSSTDYSSGIVAALCGRSAFPVPPGKILIAAIEEIGVCTSKFAERLGVHPRTVGEFILGDQVISAEMGDRIGEVLGMGDRQWAELQQKIINAQCEMEYTGISFFKEIK